MLLYCMGMYVKLNAVIAGHTLQLLIQLVGTVFFMRSTHSERDAPESRLCMPKKYELKIGVKKAWFTRTYLELGVVCKGEKGWRTLVVKDKILDP
jgi:hypothetical protein